MNRRLLIGILAVVALVATAGCLAYVTGGGEIDDETLDQDPPEDYNWESDRDAYIEIRTDATFLAVYNVTGTDEIRMYRTTYYGTEEPLDLRAFRYQYPNGTVIPGSEFRERGGEIDQTPDEVWIRFPEELSDGKIALQASSTPKRFVLPVYVTGSYEIVLPPNREATFPIAGNIAPRNYEVENRGDRQHITWENIDGGTILVQFYLERDLYIFAVIVVVATGIGLSGALYYKRKLEELREEREELGLDVDIDDDDSDGPPPGLR